MSHQPWTQEQAEKWAMESDVIRKATFEDDAIEGFKAGMAKAAAEFERIVAELRAEVAQAKREAADAMSGCCDCPMFKAQCDCGLDAIEKGEA